MSIRITLEIAVEGDPTADGISYFIRQYGTALPDDHFTPEEWVEQVVLDLVGAEIEDSQWNGSDWTVDAIHAETI